MSEYCKNLGISELDLGPKYLILLKPENSIPVVFGPIIIIAPFFSARCFDTILNRSKSILLKTPTQIAIGPLNEFSSSGFLYFLE